jgi:8-oxo-dGTP diphosphatase
LSTENIKRPIIGVGVIVWRQQKVLLGKRIDAHGEACWQFPGGHLELGESVLQCAAREVLEETGLMVDDLQAAGFTNDVFEVAGKHYVTLFVSASCMQGDPQTLEPDKCEGWRWFDYRQLPQPLFLPISHLLQQRADLKAACFGAETPAGARR